MCVSSRQRNKVINKRTSEAPKMKNTYREPVIQMSSTARKETVGLTLFHGSETESSKQKTINSFPIFTSTNQLTFFWQHV